MAADASLRSRSSFDDLSSPAAPEPSPAPAPAPAPAPSPAPAPAPAPAAVVDDDFGNSAPARATLRAGGPPPSDPIADRPPRPTIDAADLAAPAFAASSARGARRRRARTGAGARAPRRRTPPDLFGSFGDSPPVAAVSIPVAGPARRPAASRIGGAARACAGARLGGQPFATTSATPGSFASPPSAQPPRRLPPRLLSRLFGTSFDAACLGTGGQGCTPRLTPLGMRPRLPVGRVRGPRLPCTWGLGGCGARTALGCPASARARRRRPPTSERSPPSGVRGVGGARAFTSASSASVRLVKASSVAEALEPAAERMQ